MVNRESMADQLQTATFGGGCFWCLDPLFSNLVGVEDVTVGYAGGDKSAPTYEQVCSGRTGHAEVVQVTFDPERIDYRTLLEIFFSVHDPTTLNRQGADVGPQYRSIILTHNLEQEQVAHAVIDELTIKEIWPNPIVTEVKPLQAFYPAEDYHQDYFEKNPGQGYCQIVISPKVTKFRKSFADRLKQA
ncbi:MAG: peptide-methionine (S)-S-oxide reductase MsrA [Anaerolineales bacterium]|jgi:peptide-methionine (S)-S-oxide reductase